MNKTEIPDIEKAVEAHIINACCDIIHQQSRTPLHALMSSVAILTTSVSFFHERLNDEQMPKDCKLFFLDILQKVIINMISDQKKEIEDERKL